VVNDAIKTVLGSEGPWTGDGMTAATFNTLIIGKDPVAVDSVSTNIIGLNPMAADNKMPFTKSINYLKLASENGFGEYNLDNIEVIDYTTGIENEVSNSISLKQNYPNPFNSKTTLQFHAQKKMRVTLSIYNTQGQSVALLLDNEVNAGTHKINWDASGLKKGIYFCKLNAGSYNDTVQMLLA